MRKELYKDFLFSSKEGRRRRTHAKKAAPLKKEFKLDDHFLTGIRIHFSLATRHISTTYSLWKGDTTTIRIYYLHNIISIAQLMTVR